MLRSIFVLGIFVCVALLAGQGAAQNSSSDALPVAAASGENVAPAKSASVEEIAVPVSEEVTNVASVDLSGSNNATQNASVESPAAERSRSAFGAAKPKEDATPKPDLFQCYKCDSLEADNKCEQPRNDFLTMCADRKCHYIVGDLVENENTIRNFVLAGCGSAPVLSLPGQRQPVVHTKHTEPGCKSVQFTHADLGETVMSNFSLSFRGHSCNCEGSACNHVYTELFSRNGSAGISTMSFLVLSFLSVLAFIKA